MIRDNHKRFQDALKADLGRPDFESDMCVPPFAADVLCLTICTLLCRLDIGAAMGEVKDAWDNVEKWSKPEGA